ncbi:MAG: alpha/beta hydrolase [Actinomycetota bacterium]|nr:alpha/beta hydrolase [Actinomycetota bacterium]
MSALWKLVRLPGAVLLCAALASCTATVTGTGNTAGLRTPPSGASPTLRPQQIAFGSCSQIFDPSALTIPQPRASHLTFGCARLGVPLDYGNEAGPRINLELVKVHDDRNRTGNALMVNPGGPGGSGFDLALGLAGQLADRVLASFDIIGFDPRGVGLSNPVSCVSDQRKDQLNAADPNVLTPAGFAEAKSLAAAVANGCSAAYGASLADFNTVQTAMDMDRIRQSLGGQQLNYLGFSYGTELGSVYAHLFPHNVRVEVLDGAVDPLTADIAAFANQLAGFESAFDQFAQDCVGRPACAVLGNPRQVVYSLVSQADQTPLSTSNPADHRRATGSLVLTGVLSALYSKSQWGSLGDALIAARQGDAKAILALADEYNQRNPDGTYSNIYDANTAIACNDSKPGPTDATIRATALAWVKSYPMFGRWSAASLFSCQDWQSKRTPVPLPTAPTPQKVLVIGNLHDPATPYQGAKDLANTMGNALLLTWDGEGHTSYLQGNTCVDNYVNNYLISGSLPPVNTTCPR